MGSTKLLMTQVGLQTQFGTGVTPTIQAPWVVEYEDQRELHEPEMDAGAWMPVEQVMEISEGAQINVSGDAMFEMLPVLFNSAFDDVAPTGADPYTHVYLLSPTAPGTPKPLTFLTGEVGNNIGGTGPAVKFIDQYVRSVTLAGSISDKVVTLEAELFGTSYDDNSGAGYAFATPISMPANLQSMVATRGELNIQDAAATGGDFATMTAFSCALIDWNLNIVTGLQEKWCLCDNTLSWVGIQNVVPEVTLEATIRTSATNYALVKAKHDARTYQELQLIVNGDLTRKATFNLTGRWTECASAHARENNEVVMTATFGCRVPAIQTTTPHFFGCTVISKHGWT